MWNNPIGWDKYVEKPRLAMLSILIPAIIGSFYCLYSIDFEASPLNIILILGLMMSVLLMAFILFISMDNKRIKGVVTPRFEILKSKGQKYHIGVSKIHTTNLELLYNGLKKYDLIDIDKTSNKYFVSALTNSRENPDSKIFFTKNMDGVSARHFYDLLRGKFKKDSVKSIEYFFDDSNRIFKYNGEKYKPNTLYDYGSKASNCKRAEELNDVFNNIP